MKGVLIIERYPLTKNETVWLYFRRELPPVDPVGTETPSGNQEKYPKEDRLKRAQWHSKIISQSNHRARPTETDLWDL